MRIRFDLKICGICLFLFQNSHSPSLTTYFLLGSRAHFSYVSYKTSYMFKELENIIICLFIYFLVCMCVHALAYVCVCVCVSLKHATKDVCGG